MNYYNKIKNKLIDNEIYEKVKDYSKERNKVKTYYEIGELLSKAGKEYGKNIIKQYSEKLMIEVGKKYNERTLRRIRQFYEVFQNEKWSTTWTKLCWSHYREVLSLKDINAIKYYLNECEENNLTIKQLQQKIKSKEYERLDERTLEKLKTENNIEIEDYIKHPIIIKNTNNYEEISEKTLQKIILDDIPSFLKELGNGFTFIDNEYKIKIGENYNYIDLLLFNIEYNCYCVIELKVTELKKEHIGQIQTYMNYINKNLKKINHNDTIGIIICKKENKFILEYSSDPRIYETTFLLVSES